MSQRTSRLRLLGGAALLLTTLVVPGRLATGADAPVAVNGEYSGQISSRASVRFEPPAGAGGGTGLVTWDYSASGPITIRVADGAVTGNWSMSGAGIFLFLVQTPQIVINRTTTDTTLQASGTLSGQPGAATVNGDFTWYGTTTRELPMLPITVTNDPPETYTLALPITDLAIGCDLITGRWETAASQALAATGFAGTVYAYFTATAVGSTEGSNPTADRVDALTDQVTTWAARAPGITEVEQLTYLLDAHELLDQAQRIAAQASANADCAPPCDFVTPLAMATDGVLFTLTAALPGRTTSSMVALALGTGALSGCATEIADGLRTLLREDLAIRIDALLADGATADPLWELDLLDAARAAQMLGVDTFGPDGLTPADVFLLLGAS